MDYESYYFLSHLLGENQKNKLEVFKEEVDTPSRFKMSDVKRLLKGLKTNLVEISKKINKPAPALTLPPQPQTLFTKEWENTSVMQETHEALLNNISSVVGEVNKTPSLDESLHPTAESNQKYTQKNNIEIIEGETRISEPQDVWNEDFFVNHDLYNELERLGLIGKKIDLKVIHGQAIGTAPFHKVLENFEAKLPKSEDEFKAKKIDENHHHLMAVWQEINTSPIESQKTFFLIKKQFKTATIMVTGEIKNQQITFSMKVINGQLTAADVSELEEMMTELAKITTSPYLIEKRTFSYPTKSSPKNLYIPTSLSTFKITPEGMIDLQRMAKVNYHAQKILDQFLPMAVVIDTTPIHSAAPQSVTN